MPIRKLHIVPEPDQPPQRRGECQNGPRPCPWVRCRHHLLLEVTKGASISLVTPDGYEGQSLIWTSKPPRPPPDVEERWCDEAVARLERMEDTCVLDVAERGSHNLIEVAAILGVTKQRVRQIQTQGLRRLKRRESLTEYIQGATPNGTDQQKPEQWPPHA